MLHDDWLDIPCIAILYLVGLSLKWLATKIPKGNIFATIFL
jgi:hypothetical protein